MKHKEKYIGIVGLAMVFMMNVLTNGQGVETPSLHSAAIKGDIDTVKNIIEQGGNLDAKAANGYTALHCVAAAKSNAVQIASLLIQRGATVDENTTDNYRVTPLYFAAKVGNVELATLLLDKGADAGKADASGGTPLHVAA